MRLFRKLFGAVGAVVGAATCSPSSGLSAPPTAATATAAATSTSAPLQQEQLSLRIIQINDVYDLDYFPKLKSLIDHYKNNNDPNKTTKTTTKTLVICSGDFVSPSLLSSLDKGFAMVDIMNEIGVDYVCFGNHEADIPDDALRKRIQQSNFEWINSNMPDFDDKLNVDTVPYKVIEVVGSNKQRKKKVALLGLLTDDKSLYRPGAFGGATITPISTSAKYWYQKLSSSTKPEKCNGDDASSSSDVLLLLCMTHQGIAQDRDMAEEFGGGRFPLLMGGHDHEPYVEEVNGSQIVKTGMDAQKAAIIDIHWTGSDDNKPSISLQLQDTDDFPADPEILERVQSYQEIVTQLDEAKLFAIRDWVETKKKTSSTISCFSTKDNRLGPSTGTVAFASMLRMGLRCDVCLLNAGCVRAGKNYPIDGDFTWSDLKTEMPFATKMSVCKIPGRIIQATIRHSRKWAPQGIAKGGYIHVSKSCVVNEKGDVESIAGQPFDPDREYWTAFPHSFLTGIDNHEPFLEWAAKVERDAQTQQQEAPLLLPNAQSAVPCKLVLVEFFSALLWLRLGSFEEIAGEDGIITKDDVRERMKDLYGGNEAVSNLMLENVFSVADRDQSGTITLLELMVVHFAAMDMLNHVVTGEELPTLNQIVREVLSGGGRNDSPSQEDIESIVQSVLQTLDTDESGAFNRDEMLQALGEATGKDFLH